MNILQAKNRIKEIDVLMAELQQEREDLEKYISEQPETMKDLELYDLLDSNDKKLRAHLELHEAGGCQYPLGVHC